MENVPAGESRSADGNKSLESWECFGPQPRTSAQASNHGELGPVEVHEVPIGWEAARCLSKFAMVSPIFITQCWMQHDIFQSGS